MRYRVYGYCFIPAQAEIYVDARNEKDALRKAKIEWKKNKSALIVRNSSEENAAIDWRPTTEEAL